MSTHILDNLICAAIICLCLLLCSCHPSNKPHSSSSDRSLPSQTVKDSHASNETEQSRIFTFPDDTDPVTNIYALTQDTSYGPLIYYNQSDARWADYMYGGRDPMKQYGCGPTVIAMFASSFSTLQMSPAEAADWCATNGYWASGSGSHHSIIPEGLRSLGFQVESVSPSLETLTENLSSGKLLVTLMGKGTFTRQGHFLIITGMKEDGSLVIADPASYDRTLTTWTPDLILNELKYGGGSGGPMWAVSIIPNS